MPLRLRTLLRDRRSLLVALLTIGAAIAGARVFLGSSPKQSLRAPQLAQVGASLEKTLELSDKQVASLQIETAVEHAFSQEKRAVGNIDFNQNQLVAVFTPYQGRIINAHPNIGDAVEKGQVLFTIDSPDLLTAESNLIAASGVYLLQSRTLDRAKSLIKIGGISQQAMDQTTSDHQTAEGTMKSARHAVRIFGKTDAEIDKIIAERRADPSLVIKSPISGFVTARAAAPGLFVQPGVAPAPYTVADTSTMWMVANVVESDAPYFKVSQPVKASVAAYPGRTFEGKITVLGPSVDPVTRRVFVRSEIADPDHLLRAGMFANFAIVTGPPTRAAAVHPTSIVREGDGSMTVWVTSDRLRFTRRVVKTGRRQDEFVEIADGLKPAELVVGEGAVFLSNQAAITAGN